MKSTAIRLDNCKDVRIDNLKSVGFDNAIHATDTENLSATNIEAIGSQIDFDSLIKEFNLLIKETPFDNDGNIRADAIDIAIEVRKISKDKNKINLFKEKIKSIYNYIEKGTTLANVILTIATILEKTVTS